MDVTSYWAALRRVRAIYGPARGHDCRECGAPAVCWSYDGTDPDELCDEAHGYRYSRDPGYYRPRCRTCHQAEVPAVTRPQGGVCAVAGCEEPVTARGWCGAHYRRWRRHGDPCPDRPVGYRPPVDSYRAALRRVAALHGPAIGQKCAECGDPAVCWSYDRSDPHQRRDPHGWAYSLDPARYRPRCRSCARCAAAGRPFAKLLDIDWAAELYQAGATAAAIAKRVDSTTAIVLAALRGRGVTIRRPGPPPGRRLKAVPTP